MKLTQATPEDIEQIESLIRCGSGTSSTQSSPSETEYTCRACGKQFFSQGAILHDLCDEDWATYNPLAIEHRMSGRYYTVEEWLMEKKGGKS